MCFPVASAKDTHFTKTLISKVSSKVSIAFEQPKKQSLLTQLSQHIATEKQCWSTVSRRKNHDAPIHSPCLPSETNAGKQSEILELVRHESSYRSLKNKMPGCAQVSLFFCVAIFFPHPPYPWSRYMTSFFHRDSH